MTRRLSGSGIVVADPGFEQVAEDVQRLRAPRFALEEIEELRGDVGPRAVEMQIGDEERGHGTFIAGVTSRFLDPDDDDRLQRRVALERPDLAGGDGADVVDDVHAFDDAAEHGVAPAARLRIERRRCPPG